MPHSSWSSSTETAAWLDPALVTQGFGDAFRAAVGLASAAALLALVALRRSDVAPGTQPAFAGH